ncbi:MAG: polysaccharide biosynthesis protein [Thermaurantimonas sp.]|uniref:polysaccharide biosynthesis protein n=1 Tax=Thermaurantimonas sp. TaxID=2681568 RepID=UPI00391ACCDB
MLSNNSFKNAVLLITGGTGSFGNAVLKKFLDTGIKEIRIFSRDEKKQDDMRMKYKSDKIKYYIGDVRNFNSINQAMVGVDYVFHAAALKQVPSCEFYPIEAVQTNVFGSENVLESAYQNKVKKVIVLSTDKAVYPINAMGLSKALMEKVMIAKSRLLDAEKQVFCATRYGNVMASRGSVIPLFVRQIKEGKPITVTDPKMTRFMMSLEESVGLVEFAFRHAQPGDIFVHKAPATTIENIALALKEIFNASNEIKIIGTRHGEKLFETLCSREEMAKAEDLGEFFRIPADNRDLNYSKYFVKGDTKISKFEDYNSHNTRRLDLKETIDLLKNLEYIKNELNN